MSGPLVYKSTSGQKRKRVPLLLTLIVILCLITVIVVTIAVATFVKADRVMKADTKPLSPFGSNIIPQFYNSTFRTLDGQLTLQGWWIKSEIDYTVATVVMVHDHDSNRLPFDLESAPLFRVFTQNGFDVLTFDLRHTGDSDGELSSFGYTESDDVIAALQYVQTNAPDRPIILYGFGSGNCALLRALNEMNDHIDEAEPDELMRDGRRFYPRPELIAGLILDTPARSADDFIGAKLAAEAGIGRYFYPRTVPYAVRLSSGNKPAMDHLSTVSQLPLPVLMLGYEHDSVLPERAYEPLWSERQRLQPTLTATYRAPGSGHQDAYRRAQDDYLAAIFSYLDRWF